MEPLNRFHSQVIREVSDTFFRYLYGKINWDQRMLAVKGPRGSGKTTMLLQRIRHGLGNKRALYITADHHWFYTNTLFETAESFYNEGGRYLFIDEVHKYPGWSVELKNIYDGFSDLKIVFSASSALDIYKGEADLSRRVITYELPGMSFREYLMLNKIVDSEPVSLQILSQNHELISETITDNVIILPLFRSYLKSGYLPIIAESDEDEIPLRLNQVINAVIDSDLAYTEGIDSSSSARIKRLLGVIAESAPFKPNIASLARKLDVSRDSVYTWMHMLEKAGLLNLLKRKGKGVSVLQKPDKIYLENTNLTYALRENPDRESLRETFIFSQLKNAGYNVTLPSSGDFFADNFTIEVGGKNKTANRLSGTGNPLVAADDIERGYGNKIPLWLFGFLY